MIQSLPTGRQQIVPMHLTTDNVNWAAFAVWQANTLRLSAWQFQDEAQEASHLHRPVEQPIERLAAGILMPACLL
jgi:hypothetical protein